MGPPAGAFWLESLLGSAWFPVTQVPVTLPSFSSALDSGSDLSSCPLQGTHLPPVMCTVASYLQCDLHLVQVLSTFSIT